jgi:hypothetical protein
MKLTHTDANTEQGAWNKLYTMYPQLLNKSIKQLEKLGYEAKKERKEKK